MEAKNEMPALTDEQRKELIEFAQNEFHYWNDGGPYQQLIQIALASLEANPEELPSIFDSFKAETDWQKGFLAGQKEYLDDLAEIGPLYSAPPVPALKLPAEIKLHGDMDEVAVYHWNAAIAEVKKLNGVTNEQANR